MGLGDWAKYHQPRGDRPSNGGEPPDHHGSMTGGADDPHRPSRPFHGTGGSGGDGGSIDGYNDGYHRDHHSRGYYKKTFAMKPDVKYFKELKSIGDFPEWYDSIAATLVGTGLGVTCDFTYTPPPEEFKDYKA